MHTMGPVLNKMGNKKIYQNNYFRPHFHFLICLVFPGIPLDPAAAKYKLPASVVEDSAVEISEDFVAVVVVVGLEPER